MQALGCPVAQRGPVGVATARHGPWLPAMPGFRVSTPVRVSVTCSSNSSQRTAAAAAAAGTSRRRGVISAAAPALAPPTYAPPAAKSVVLELPGGKQIKLETGEIGRQANGAVMATCGETMLYATACCAPNPSGDGSFVPLTVNYAERFSAAGRTSGGFVKRDGRPRDAEVLVSRLVDRPLRPMFQKGWANETQVLEWVMSYDGVNEPEPIAITAAAAALLISDIPLKKAVAGVRVGLLPDGGFVINPTVQEMQASRLDLVLAGTADAVLMIEGFCDFLPEDTMMKALEAGAAAVASLCRQMEAWAKEVGKPKLTHCLVPLPEALEERLMGLVGPQLREAYRTSLSKEVRGAAVGAAEAAAAAALAAEAAAGAGGNGAAAVTPQQLSMALKAVESRVMRQLVLDEQLRADGRGVTDVRPITSRAGVLPRTHGSALFTRGETQALCVATLGSTADSLRADSMRRADGDDADFGRFYLQYHFPPSSVGETGRVGAPGRRELGHGELAQRALAPALPPAAAFPYTVRLEATITESNGSSSMASVCGGYLALLDAGVPVSRPIAGIAMGLILDDAQPSTVANGQPPQPPTAARHVVLSDIMGLEDALGDMDFKVAGDVDAITAFQMDIKVEGITLPIMAAALAQAREGRRAILGAMDACRPPPARALSKHAPRLARLQVDPSKKGAIIGAGGRNIRQLLEASGASTIDIDEGGQVLITAPTQEAAATATEFLQLLSSDPEPGTIFRDKPVVSIAAFGCFVELCPGRQGLLHVSELGLGGGGGGDGGAVGAAAVDVAAAVRVGDRVDVMVLSCDAGKVSLSRRAVQAADRGEAYEAKKRPSGGAGGGGGGRGGGGGGRGGRGGGGGSGERTRRP